MIHRKLVPITLLLLPVLALSVLLNCSWVHLAQNTHRTDPLIRPTLRKENRMPDPAYFYKSVSGFASNYQPASAFTLPAPNLYDHNELDTTTGYLVHVTNNNIVLCGLVDLSPMPTPVAYYTVALSVDGDSGQSFTYNLAHSLNGENWTEDVAATLNLESSGHGSVSLGRVPLNNARAATAAQFWQLTCETGSTDTSAVNITDFRLYDVNGNQIGPVPATAPRNLTLTFSTSAGGPPNLSAAWQQPAQGQPDSYNFYLGKTRGAEAFALNVPGNALAHTFAAYGYGAVYGYLRAVFGGAEGGASIEVSAAALPAAPLLTAAGETPGGVPAILLTTT